MQRMVAIVATCLLALSAPALAQNTTSQHSGNNGSTTQGGNGDQSSNDNGLNAFDQAPPPLDTTIPLVGMAGWTGFIFYQVSQTNNSNNNPVSP